MHYIPLNTKLQCLVCDLIDIYMLNKSIKISVWWMPIFLKKWQVKFNTGTG